jgi:hypothetical protein
MILLFKQLSYTIEFNIKYFIIIGFTMVQESAADSILHALLAGVDRCGVYICDAEWQAMASNLGFDINLKAPEAMMKDVIEFAEQNGKNDILKTMLLELFSARVKEYEDIKTEFGDEGLSFLRAAKLSLTSLQRIL